MRLFPIIIGLLVLAACAAILSLVLNVIKAVLIVSAIGLGIGVALGLRRKRSTTRTRITQGK